MNPAPMNPSRLARLRDQPDSLTIAEHRQHVAELLADREWHRMRMTLSDDDVRYVRHDELVAWIEAQPALRYIAGIGVYLVDGDRESLIVPAEDEMHPGCYSITGRRLLPITGATVTKLALRAGVAPLDALAQIWGT